MTKSSDFLTASRRRLESDILEAKKKAYAVFSSSDIKLKTALLRFVDNIFPEKYKVGVLRMPKGTSYEDELFKVGTVPAFFPLYDL